MLTKVKAFTAYCLYDWANSPFATVVITFVFAAYFEKAIVGEAEKASILWGWSISISAFIIACLSPFIGRHIDTNASYKFWISVFTFVLMRCRCGAPSRSLLVTNLLMVFLLLF